MGQPLIVDQVSTQSLLGEYNKILHPRLHDVETEPLRFLSGCSRDKEKVDVETFYLKQVM